MLYLCSSLKETEDEGYFSNVTFFFERKGIKSARFLLLLRFFLRLIPSFFFFEIIRIEETDGILFEIVLFFRGGNDGISLSGGRERERERSRVSRAWLAIRRFLFLHLFWQCSHSLVLLSASQPVPSPSLSLPLLSRPSYPAFARFHSFLLQFPPLFLLS